ncbi:GATA transcription factor 16-like [Ipomoea triloba]|uniref:GATA transcription factor 16-like n=1 Tax=Ipomoea triloba TaxID=35885 RepID=UPI00125E1FA3|nr:GATA transcription factor 16-like [Ipomoea triloba]
MADLSDRGSESEEMNNQAQTPESETSTQIKTCADCGTTKTPLWRGGPAGPKSLCNACGIRSRKKRRALLGLNKDDKKSKKAAAAAAGNKNHQNSSNNSGTTSDSGSSSGAKSGVPQALRRKLVPPFGIGREVALQRPRSQQQRRKLGEVERAAFVLMSLSCGSVYA